MIRRGLLIAVFGATFIGSACANGPLQQSPITPGLWAWPGHKAANAKEVADLCRNKLEIQFADGRYLGVKLRNGGKALNPPVIDEIGRCHFSRDTQTDHCALKEFADGLILTGLIESRFSYDADKTLRMSVKVTITSGDKDGGRAFDVFPVKCPVDLVWDSLLPTKTPK